MITKPLNIAPLNLMLIQSQILVPAPIIILTSIATPLHTFRHCRVDPQTALCICNTIVDIMVVATWRPVAV